MSLYPHNGSPDLSTYRHGPLSGCQALGNCFLKPDFDPTLTDISLDKTKVQALKQSFAHYRRAIRAFGDADKPQEMFNRETTSGGSFVKMDRHWGEHLGQSIACARIKAVVPPCSEEFQRQPADKPKALGSPRGTRTCRSIRFVMIRVVWDNDGVQQYCGVANPIN